MKKYKLPPIRLKDLRIVFLPMTFEEKYGYLGCVPWQNDSELFKALKPLVLLMDLKAKPQWCPRWFLRLLNLLGNDNSIVRVRNIRLSNLFSKLTKGFRFIDYKTKWTEYDLRISIHGDNELMFLLDSIEEKFYRDGRKKDLVKRLSKMDLKTNYEFYTLNDLEKRFEELSPKY